MTTLPEAVRQAWKDHDGPAVFTTIGANALPNAVYVTCVGLMDDGRFVVADNYFNKTRENLKRDPKGALLFIDKTGKAFQLKGAFEYHTEGGVFDFMKSWNPEKHPGHAAVALVAQEIYSGAEKLA